MTGNKESERKKREIFLEKKGKRERDPECDEYGQTEKQDMAPETTLLQEGPQKLSQ